MTWPISIDQQSSTLCFYGNIRRNSCVLTEGVFVTQLSSNSGISVWRIVWVMTNCCFVNCMFVGGKQQASQDKSHHFPRLRLYFLCSWKSWQRGLCSSGMLHVITNSLVHCREIPQTRIVQYRSPVLTLAKTLTLTLFYLHDKTLFRSSILSSPSSQYFHS